MQTAMIAAAVCGVILIVFSVIRKIRHGGGCCGEHEAAAAKIRAADRDPSHYPYHYTVGIEGMVCARCVRNAENAFHAAGGIYAVADLGSKSARLYAVHPLTRREAAAVLDGTGYTLTDFKEEKE